MNEEFNVLADGDIILRAQCSPNNHKFRVHKLVLSLASPVFKDMFGITQPRRDMLNVDIEVIYMTDPPQGLDSDLVLRLIYSFPPPNVNSLVPPVEGPVTSNLVLPKKPERRAERRVEGATRIYPTRLDESANDHTEQRNSIRLEFSMLPLLLQRWTRRCRSSLGYSKGREAEWSAHRRTMNLNLSQWIHSRQQCSRWP